MRPGRSERLADLAVTVGATTYLCGTGGAKYLDEKPFAELGVAVQYVPAVGEPRPEWNRLSALGAIATEGRAGVRLLVAG
ncbi:WbqC family protein [Amycolatopsis balhimycina]|uniref:WbqC family protein n=1 Tax=Amycolatopsis balhimycina TaxID=208443 RepID=UPI00039F2665|nr:WbqC family protein [Amycolatopsis balhimycina]